MQLFEYIPKNDLLDNRVIMVTGASEGIGRTAAKNYAAYGATVILHGRNVERLESLYDEIIDLGYKQPAIFPLDFSEASFDDFMNLKHAIEEELGQLDGLLHNASILGQRSAIQDINTKDWSTVMQVNVNAQFMLTKAMLPLMLQSDDASIIFTSSSVGRKGRAFWGSYAVSKFATEGLMQVLADELETTSNIRVNTLNPGATRTAMRKAAYPGEDPENNPAPEEIMPLYLYLMGPDSKDENGKAFNVRQ